MLDRPPITMAEIKLGKRSECGGCAAKMNKKVLESILKDFSFYRSDDVIIGIEDYDDAGVFRLKQGMLLVQSLDFFPPIVDDPFVFGQIAAANALSDIYLMGANPITALNICCFPKEYDTAVLSAILNGAADRLSEAECSLIGGHTIEDEELKFGMSVSGICRESDVVSNSKALPGDKLYLTKKLGTGIAATALKADILEDSTLKQATESMISLNKPVMEYVIRNGIKTATDITGFGLAGHAIEICTASKAAMILFADNIPVFNGIYELMAQGMVPEGSYKNRDIFSCYIDIQSAKEKAEIIFDAQTSGGALLCVPQSKENTISELIDAVYIGEVIERSPDTDTLITVL